MKWTQRRKLGSTPSGDRESIRTIVERSAAAISSQLESSPHVTWIDAGELRGYVRALAATVVRQQAAQWAKEAESTETLTTEELRRAVEQTVHSVMRRQLVDLHAAQTRRRAA